MELIDTHAHLDDEKFAADLEAVLERAAASERKARGGGGDDGTFEPSVCRACR